MKSKQPTILLSFLFIISGFSSPAQSTIDAFNTAYISANNAHSYTATPVSGGSFNACSGSTFTYSFGNGSSNLLKLLDITTNGKNYFIANNTLAIVKLRRVNNAVVNGSRSIISQESTLTSTAACPASLQINLKTSYSDQMETFLNTNYINQGTDNIFTNTGNGDGNNNNIERVDVIFPSGLASAIASEAGFAIFERGNNNAHDGFRIAAITTLNGSGDPASFGAVKTCTAGNGSTNGNWGHPSLANGNKTFAVYVLRKDQNETRLKVSAAVNQQVGAVFFSFADLGIAANQTIYGYSVLAVDGIANPTSAQLLNLNDASVYPTNTNDGVGGLDMMAINAVFQTSSNPLSVKKADVSALLSNEMVLVKWNVGGLDSKTVLTIERSFNKVDFFPTHQVSVTATASVGTWYDQYLQPAYYRLKIQPVNSTAYYSAIVAVSKVNAGITIYPTLLNPGQSITIKGLADGRYQAALTSVNGRQLMVNINVVGKAAVIPANIFSSLKGVVYLSVKDNYSQILFTRKIVVE